MWGDIWDDLSVRIYKRKFRVKDRWLKESYFNNLVYNKIKYRCSYRKVMDRNWTRIMRVDFRRVSNWH